VILNSRTFEYRILTKMKKSFIITLAISLISMGVKAQSLDKLIGNWEFSSVYNAPKLDAGTVKKTKDMYEGSQMYFYEDGSYYFSNSTKDEDGTYTLAGKTTSTKDESSKISKIEII